MNSHPHTPSGFSSSSPTARVIDGLALYGHTPGPDEPEYRPMPEAADLDGIVKAMFGSLTAPLSDTALEPELPDVLWSLVDVLHRKADRVQRFLDENELRQRGSQEDQDGSEIRSVELERLIDRGRLLSDKRTAFEHMRDAAAERYELFTGSPWRPRTGSMVNHKNKTAAMVESRDFISAKRRSETEIMLPEGPKIAFAGGTEFNDTQAIWSALDAILAKHPKMVLMHGGNVRGAERIAACWAASRKVTDIAFKPAWKDKADKSAPFKRNDRMLEIMPIGVVVFPGNGITDNLADKARKLGIPLHDLRPKR